MFFCEMFVEVVCEFFFECGYDVMFVVDII